MPRFINKYLDHIANSLIAKSRPCTDFIISNVKMIHDPYSVVQSQKVVSLQVGRYCLLALQSNVVCYSQDNVSKPKINPRRQQDLCVINQPFKVLDSVIG